MHDEYLFIRSAQAILDGNWLGPYDHLTLIKGPFYPLWIAASNILGVPLLLSQHLLYISASLVLALAISPVLPGWKTTIFLFAVLIFNPMSFAGEVMPRVMREGIYPALTMLCMAGALGIFLRSGQSESACRPWSLILAISLPAFWLTREEGFWIIPGLIILHVATWLRFCKYLKRKTAGLQKVRLLKMCMLIAIPYFVLFISIGVISGINRHHYGVFTVVEINSRPFTSAYGALSRTAPSETRRYVPVPRDLRQKIYTISPAFEQLRPYLEGSVGQKWIGIVCAAAPSESIPPDSDFYRYSDLIKVACDDLAGGWFVWALRDSAAAAGFHSDALKAQSFYKQLAHEINEACEKGMIDCQAERNTLAPPFKTEYIPHLADSMLSGLVYLFSFKNFSAIPLQSWGAPERLSVFARITGSRLYLLNHHTGQQTNKIRIKILEAVGNVYQKVGPWMGIIFILPGLIFFRLFRKNFLFFSFLIPGFSLVAAITARLVMLSIIDVASFPAISTQYLSPIYPLMLFLCCFPFVFVGYQGFEKNRFFKTFRLKYM